MPIVTAICKYCRKKYTGNNAAKLAAKCESKVPKTPLFKKGEQIGLFIVHDIKFKPQTHSLSYVMMYKDGFKHHMSEAEVGALNSRQQMVLDTRPEYVAPLSSYPEDRLFSTRKARKGPNYFLGRLLLHRKVAVRSAHRGKVVALRLIGDLVYGVYGSSDEDEPDTLFFLLKFEYLDINLREGNTVLSAFGRFYHCVINRNNPQEHNDLQRVTYWRESLSYEAAAEMMNWQYLDSPFNL
jgi:hypothetical protein